MHDAFVELSRKFADVIILEGRQNQAVVDLM